MQSNLMTIQNISKPGRVHLIVFSVISLPFITLFIFYCQFIWIFNLVLQIPFFLIAAALSVFTGYWLDNKYKVHIRKYIVTALLITLLLLILSVPISAILQKQSERKGERLIERIEAYKLANGHFPANIEGDYFSKAPKRTLIGTKYFYNRKVDVSTNIEYYNLQFRAFNGNTAYYNTDSRKWLYTD